MMEREVMMVLILYSLLLHFIADFICQTRYTAQNKATHLVVLVSHATTVWFVFVIGSIILLIVTRDPNMLNSFILFGFVNATMHGIIDWNIWRLYNKFVTYRKIAVIDTQFKYWEDKYYYMTIGLDQMLHAVVIIVLATLILHV